MGRIDRIIELLKAFDGWLIVSILNILSDLLCHKVHSFESGKIHDTFSWPAIYCL
jgi:hypothetical protein